MPARKCPECRSVVPSSEYKLHRSRHARQRNPRKTPPPGWAGLRSRILSRDGHRCVVCGASERLEVDHIDGNPDNHAPENLRTVCFDHNPRGGQLRFDQR